MIHLHWLFRQGPEQLRGVVVGVTLCGITAARKDLTAFTDDATCQRCLEAATKEIDHDQQDKGL